MDLRASIMAATKQAMKDKAANRLSTLRLISAAIKDRDIAARAEGNDEGVGDDELEDLVDTLGDFTDAEFVNAFFEQCPLVEKWLAEIVVHERGESPQCVTLSYEAMMYNPYDQIRTLIHRFWPEFLNSIFKLIRMGDCTIC